MMRVTTLYAGTAATTAGYYTRYLTEASGELPGQRLGEQADRLGLTGEVTTETLEALLSGLDPVAGRPLGQPLVDRVTSNGKVIRPSLDSTRCCRRNTRVQAARWERGDLDPARVAATADGIGAVSSSQWSWSRPPGSNLPTRADQPVGGRTPTNVTSCGTSTDTVGLTTSATTAVPPSRRSAAWEAGQGPPYRRRPDLR